jgi:hypothetical protein
MVGTLICCPASELSAQRSAEDCCSEDRQDIARDPASGTVEHMPAGVLRAYLDAEKAFPQGIWNLAAAVYRKAVDRGIMPLIGDEAKTKMLGPEIGMLERTSLLPPTMLDWIRVVKDDGNFALHDDDHDHDLDTRKEVEPAREFAFTLLTYLYTLPEKVRIAQGLPKEEGSTA